MRKTTLASLFLFVGLSSSLMFACNGNSDDGSDNGTGGAGTGGTGTGGGNGLGGGSSTGGGGSDDVCSATGSRGTTVATGTCNKIIDFETDLKSGYASDGRSGTGLDMDGDTPRISGGKIVAPATTPSGTGTLEQAADGADGTSESAHFTFTGGVEWGGAFSVLVSNNECYDASFYTGITFWAKAAAASKKDIFVGVGTAATNPLYNCPPTDDCYNTGRKTFTLTSDWAQYSATWAELKKPSWGTNWGSTTEDTKDQIVSITFSDAGALATGNDIEIFVDEVAFVGGDASACATPGMGGAGGI